MDSPLTPARCDAHKIRDEKGHRVVGESLRDILLSGVIAFLCVVELAVLAAWLVTR